jgi:signal transduction histidine kinase/CheY-like chemotaxis protein
MKETSPISSYGLAIVWLFLLFSTTLTQAQYRITAENMTKVSTLHGHATVVNVGQKEYSLEELMKDTSLVYVPLKQNQDLGFTHDNYWVKFELYNATSQVVDPFIETCRPIVDLADLYLLRPNQKTIVLKSGDLIPFHKRILDNRKTLFRVVLAPKTKTTFYLHLRSDGETINLPLYIKSVEKELELFSFEQNIFGFFYGILFLAAIVYLFFFYGMREQSFLYYSLYVVFIGLLQFSVDGYFYQYISPNNPWLTEHCVLICATFANFFLGMYALKFLHIRHFSKLVYWLFYALFVLDLLSLLSIVFIHDHSFLYPVANALGLVLLVLIITSVVIVYQKTKMNDRFFTLGIFFLIAGFVIFILKNFGVIPALFWTENGSKLGTGLEVIFLSLSMANLIRNLKNEREEMQALALQRSEEMNELKSYFLSNISHELRTPLNAIMSLSDVTSQETDSKKIKQNCDIIRYSSMSLLNSVNDILDFSKIEKGELKLELAPFSPSKIIEQLKKTAKMAAKEKGLKIKFTVDELLPDTLVGDAARFSQMANNLLNNALKFTNEGWVRVDLRFEKKGDAQGQLVLEVRDSGIGIPKEKLKSIFDSFSQESIDNKRKFGGLGLGLFIVKALVDLHGGKVAIQSQHGIGTICTLTLAYEIAKVEPKVVTIVANTDYDLKGKRILVVEDNAMNQMVIKMITKKWLNTTVDFANNGAEGVNQLKESPYDIVLMDLQMPVMDGYEATIAIRNGEAGDDKKNIPIIAVTADVMETTKERVFEIGMNQYLSKPVDKDVLFENIKSLV